MRATRLISVLVLDVAVLLIALTAFSNPANATDLKILKLGLGSGTVSSSPAGIDCGTDCDEPFGSPVSVMLTAVAAPGAVFLRWEGDCSGSSTTCTVTMDADRSVR